MNDCWLTFELMSDATFGRGDGVSGLVDAEVQHDQSGLPYLGGRAIKGLLRDACDDILFALKLQGKGERWERAAAGLLGKPGSDEAAGGALEVGDAALPGDLRNALKAGIDRGDLRRALVLESLTAIRRQTAVDERTGVPSENTLRAQRVILRSTPFAAALHFRRPPDKDELALLAACVKAWRRAGTGRNRGRGALAATLNDAQGQDITAALFERFRQGVMG